MRRRSPASELSGLERAGNAVRRFDIDELKLYMSVLSVPAR